MKTIYRYITAAYKQNNYRNRTLAGVDPEIPNGTRKYPPFGYFSADND
jgi:hypothetical protein